MNSPTETRNPQTLRYIAILLGLICAFLVTVEAGTRVLMPRISRIAGRTEAEYRAALLPAKSERPLLLVLGNSLLIEGVQFDRLRQEVAADFEARRFVVEQTSYFDWRYGLRKLFNDGARPKVIVLMLAPTHLTSYGSRGEYSSYFLTSHHDVPHLSRDLDLHPTNSASMLVANLSAFYGMRGEIRKVILGKLIPSLPNLTNRLTTTAASPTPEPELRRLVKERAQALRLECESYGARLVLALPPAPRSYKTLLAVKEAAQEGGVATLVPFGADDFAPSDFADGFHLNAGGAARFTELLAEAVRSLAPTRP